MTEYYKNFKRREPKVGIAGRIDTTAIRFVDVATKEELEKEYELVKDKKSELKATERGILTKFFEV